MPLVACAVPRRRPPPERAAAIVAQPCFCVAVGIRSAGLGCGPCTDASLNIAACGSGSNRDPVTQVAMHVEPSCSDTRFSCDGFICPGADITNDKTMAMAAVSENSVLVHIIGCPIVYTSITVKSGLVWRPSLYTPCSLTQACRCPDRKSVV